MHVHSSPPLSLLLPSHGTPNAKDSSHPFTTREQWLWHFYLTAWPRRFFAKGTEAMPFEAALKAVEFPTAETIEARVMEWQSRQKQKDGQEQNMSDIANGYVYPQLPQVTESAFGRALRAIAVRDFFSSLSSSSSTSTSTSTPTSSVLAAQWSAGLDEMLREALSHVYGARGCYNNCETEELAVAALRAVLSPDGGNPYRHVLLFDAQIDHPKGFSNNNNNKNENHHHDNASSDMLLRNNDSSSRILLQRSRLFAVLAVEVFGRVKTACARVLLAYINHAPDRLVDIRICGVVMGIIEYAMAYDRWRADSDGTGRSPLHAAAMLLHAIVNIQSTHEKEIPAVRLATMIVSCVEELLFATVAGGPFEHAAHGDIHGKEDAFVRPIAVRGLTLHEADVFLQSFLPAVLQQVGFEWPWSESLRRARQLDKVDTSTGTLYQAEEQQRQQGEKKEEDEEKEEKEKGEEREKEALVRLSSQAVFHECITALSHRTYAARLRGIFPQSFDPFIDAIFPNKVIQLGNGNGNNDNEEERASAQQRQQQQQQRGQLFTLPEYYRAAAEPLLEFFARSGLSGTTAEETERILQRGADVIPMIVQLQALGTRDNNNSNSTAVMYDHMNNRNDHGAGRGDSAFASADDDAPADSVGYNERLHGQTTAFSTRLSSVRLSNGEKQRLVLRYRCEVLLAALIVHTQLRTISHVQQLVRQLAPLFEKLLLPLLHERTLDGPLVMRTRRIEQNDSTRSHSTDVESSVPLRFSPEAKVLMDDIHYQFYPLEWIPDAVDAFLLSEPKLMHESRPHLTHFSVFAAVAHQFGISLMGSPQGLRGGDGTDPITRVKVHRLFHVFLLNALADAPVSSCEAEGAAALSVTRRVGAIPTAAVMNAACDSTISTTTTTTAVAFHTVVNPHDVVLTLAQCLLPPELISGGAKESLRRVAEWAPPALAARARHYAGKGPLTRANSRTWDAVPLARGALRAVRRRLLEKMRLGESIASEEHSDGEKISVRRMVIDPLLQQQLDSLPGLLESIGLLPQSGIAEEERKECRAVELLWGSPLFAQEIRLSGFYNSI